MSDIQRITDPGYQALVEPLSAVYSQGRIQAHRAVNEHLIQTFWQIGHDIVEFEQGGQARASYGQALLTNLCRDLGLRHGKGFSRSNIIRARQFYLAHPKGATLSHLLSWSHVVELLKLDDPLERGFYEQQCAREKWAFRELQRQIKSSLFLRLATSRVNPRHPSATNHLKPLPRYQHDRARLGPLARLRLRPGRTRIIQASLPLLCHQSRRDRQFHSRLSGNLGHRRVSATRGGLVENHKEKLPRLVAELPPPPSCWEKVGVRELVLQD